jgi:hypothetical protein
MPVVGLLEVEVQPGEFNMECKKKTVKKRWDPVRGLRTVQPLPIRQASSEQG